jgi:hypothetical protein
LCKVKAKIQNLQEYNSLHVINVSGHCKYLCDPTNRFCSLTSTYSLLYKSFGKKKLSYKNLLERGHLEDQGSNGRLFKYDISGFN